MARDLSNAYGVKHECLDCQFFEHELQCRTLNCTFLNNCHYQSTKQGYLLGTFAACTPGDCMRAVGVTQRYVRELAARGITKVRILGVDFDNTITSKDSFPSIAPFREGAIQCLTEFQTQGGVVGTR